MLKTARITILFFLLFVRNLASSDDQLEINADQFTYDKENTRIYATGNVEIIDDEFKLFAQKVFLNNTSKVLSARDDIKVFDLEDGSILKAEKIVADQSLRNAIIEKNYLFIPSEDFNSTKNFLKLAAERVERRDKFWEKLDYGVFTACEVCFNEKEKKFDEPLVQFKAKKIIHDKKSMDVRYYDAFLDIKGNSIFYLPYFSHASPLVKRRSGLLAPNFFQSHFFGLGADIPYYFVIDDYQDFTFKPKFSLKKNPAFFLEHRKNFLNGEIKSEFSGTLENQNVNQLKKDKKRGHFKSVGSFDLTKNTYLDYQIHRTTDRHYLNTYKYNYQDVLETKIKLEGHRDYNFYSLQSYLFQDLRKKFNQKEVPKILPRILLNLNSPRKPKSLNLSTNIEIANIVRSEGAETKKFFINQNMLYPVFFPDGTNLKLGAHINAGLYNIEKYNNPVNGNYEFNKFKNNFYPQFTLEISKPYHKNNLKYSSIITPKIMLIKGNKKGFNRKIPDESNVNNFDFDFTDLFNRNRLAGNDREDNLTRIDYGFSFLKNSNQNSKTTIIEIGQSYQFEKHKYLHSKSGINKKFSDIVGRVAFDPNDVVSIDSFFTIEEENFSIKTAYTNLRLRQKNSYLQLKNIYAPPVVDSDGTNEIEAKNQFSVSFNQEFSDFWSFTTSTTFDKKNTIKFHNIGAKIKYEDECLGLSFSWNRQYTHNPEDPTSNSFIFLFSFKEIMENDL